MRRNLKIESRDDVRSRISSTGPINTLSVPMAQALLHASASGSQIAVAPNKKPQSGPPFRMRCAERI